MKSICIRLKDEAHTQDFANKVAEQLRAPMVIGFAGDLGAGKTTFIRAMLRSLGVKGAIKSPTYALVERYECDNFLFYHFDLYRIAAEDELEFIGFRDCLTTDAVSCIEWPQNTVMSQQVLDICCELQVDGRGRTLNMQANSALGKQWLKTMAGL